MNNTKYDEFKVLLDLPARQPVLGFESYANALADIILRSTPQFAIGIYGPWGSGKTTLMSLIDSKLRDLAKERTDLSLITIQFSAWRYEKEEHLIVPLLDVLREGLVAWTKAKESLASKAIKESAKIVGDAITALVAGLQFKAKIPVILEVGFDAGKAIRKAESIDSENADTFGSFYHDCFVKLQMAFDALPDGTRIVVFLDDLDRCLASKALQVLESMKLFFDLPNFVFVAGVDHTVLESLFCHKFENESRKSKSAAYDGRLDRLPEYVQKLFQIPFHLPPIPVTQLEELVQAIVRGSDLPPKQKKDILTKIKPHLVLLFSEEQLSIGGVNARQIKRFINSYTLQMKTKPHLNPDAVLAILTIQNRADWKTAWVQLVSRRQVFLNALKETIENQKDDHLKLLEQAHGALPRDFLDYMRDAGKVLLSVSEQVAEYLHTGSLDKGQSSVLAGDLLSRLMDIRTDLDKVESGSEKEDDPRFLLSQIDRLQSELRGVISSSTAPASHIHALDELVEYIRPRLSGLPGEEMDIEKLSPLIDKVRWALENIIVGRTTGVAKL